MATISFSWGAEATNIGSVLNSGDSDKYFSLPISTINTALNSLPANAVITNITLTTRFIADPKYGGSYNCAVGYGGSGSITKELNRVSNGSTNYWDSTISCSLNEIISGRQLNTNLGSYITYNIWTDGGYGKKSYYVGTNAGTDPYLSVTYSIPTYTVTVSSNNSSYGYTTGGGTYASGSTATLTATPNPGYKFASWNDGNTSATRTVTVTGNATYTAYFEPVYVIYDSIFSFKKWIDKGLNSWALMNILNVTETGFTGEALVGDAYTQDSKPVINVTAGKQYTVDFQAGYPPAFQLFVFFTDANGVWNGAIENLDLVSNGTSKTFTPTTNYIVIRCDIDGTGNINTFSDFRIYPAEYGYMSTTVSAAERTDVGAWSMPTPKRDGYIFKGWNTKPDGTGTTYTSSSAFPTSDTTLYSQWEKNNNKIITNDSYGQDDCIGVYVQPSSKNIIFKTQNTSFWLDGEGADTVDGWHIKVRYPSDTIFEEAETYEVSEIYISGERFY